MLKENLIKDIKTKLGIDGGSFIDTEIDGYISKLRPAQYQEFFNALSGSEFKFHKGIDRIAIVAKKFFGEPQSDYEQEADIISSLMHSINKVVIEESISKGEDYTRLMRAIDIRKTFDIDSKQAYVLNDVGGREAIMNVNTKEPNSLIRRIVSSLEKYDRENTGKTLAVANSMTKNLIADLTAQKRN